MRLHTGTNAPIRLEVSHPVSHADPDLDAIGNDSLRNDQFGFQPRRPRLQRGNAAFAGSFPLPTADHALTFAYSESQGLPGASKPGEHAHQFGPLSVFVRDDDVRDVDLTDPFGQDFLQASGNLLRCAVDRQGLDGGR